MSNPQFFAHDQLNDLVCPIVSHQQEVMHSVHERSPLLHSRFTPPAQFIP